jgi:CRP-like cAMP-binding protein
MCVRRFASREFVCRKGEYQLDLCFILRGTVDLYDHAADESTFKVGSLSEGDFFGELGAIRGQPRTTDLVAATGDTRLLFVPRHAIASRFRWPTWVARRMVTERYQERAIRVLAQELELFKGARRHSRMRWEPSGEFFGEMAWLGGGVRSANVLTAGKCELVKLSGAALMESALPRGRKAGARRSSGAIGRQSWITAELSDLLERSGQLGYVQAAALLVMDLDLCVKRDNCVKACESMPAALRVRFPLEAEMRRCPPRGVAFDFRFTTRLHFLARFRLAA